MTARWDLGVVLVTYNSAGVVESALTELPNWADVSVVDNCSTDESVATAQRIRPSALITENPSNRGFAQAVNVGVRKLSNNYLLLLNPDAKILSADLEILLEYLERNPDVGVASPEVVEGSGHLTTVAGGYAPTIWRMFTHSSGLSRFGRRWPALRGHYLLRDQFEKADSATHLDWVSGGCMLVRRETWDRLGGLTERWFMYAEDVEFCLRVRDAGEGVVILPSAVAQHAVGASSAGAETIRTAWIENLFDLYQSRYRAGFIRRNLWRWVCVGGYFARGAVSALRQLRGAPGAKHDRERFVRYAGALIGAGQRALGGNE